MPTFTLDIYKDWTPEQLRVRCRKLSRALIRDQRIVAMLVEYAPEGLQHLPAEYQKQAKHLNAAYRDEPTDTGSVM
jgi:hypothetical protein